MPSVITSCAVAPRISKFVLCRRQRENSNLCIAPFRLTSVGQWHHEIGCSRNATKPNLEKALRSPKPCTPMATYAHGNFEQIASAIGMEVGQIAKHENRFEAAAYWYRLDKRRPTRITPSKSREKLDRIAKAARRLLASLGVNDPDEAADGPRDPEILNALVLVGEPNADAVIEATRRIGRLMEILDSIAAAAEFDRRAKKAATEVAEVGKLTVRQGNPGDDAVNDWIADMMSIYRMITGNEPATSVGAPERGNEAIAAGPLVRFLEAAGKPLNTAFSEDAWRSRVRTVLKGASGQN